MPISFIYILTLCFLPLLFFPFSGCSKNQTTDSKSDSSKEISLTDSRGKKISLSNPPGRIISLGPNMTEIICALGKEQFLVGRTDYCDFPESVKEIPSVGDIMEPNLEIIVELNPDLIFASTHVSEKTISRLEQLGLPVVALENTEDFSGLENLITDCAGLLGAENEKKILLNEIKNRRKKVKEKATMITEKPTVYFALGYGKGGDWTAGNETFIDDMISLAGGENIVKNSGWSYSKELLIENDPDIILVGKGKKDEFNSLPLYKTLSASQTGNVYEIDENIITRTSPRAIEGLEAIQNILFEYENHQKNPVSNQSTKKNSTIPVGN